MCRLWVFVYTAFFASLTISAEPEDAQTFIIRVENDLKPSTFSEAEQWYSATLRSLSSIPLANKKSQSTLQIKEAKDFIHVYKTVFHGFSARLTQQQAQELKTRQGILAVLPDRIRQIQTTRSTQFLGLLANSPHGPLTESDSGSNVVIGILDTGISPEHPSFHDEGLPPVPPSWKGECIEGEQFTKNLCNKKILGARYFHAGYEARSEKIEVRSPRDTQGHGTHTASIAAGRAVDNASVFGYATGVAVGVAPKARVASYKICWAKGCMDSDILAGIDKAVEDGVDVISISVGGGTLPYHLDPIAIGAFGAMERGVFVSASAGNDGPVKMTVTNVAPWITTVGASTIDRKFPADLVLEDGTIITGASLYSGNPLPENQLFPLIYAGNASIAKNSIRSSNSAICMPESLDKELVRGKIVLCERGGIARVEKANVIKDAGGIGVIVANVAPLGEGLVADPYMNPGMLITESANHKVQAYISLSSNPRGTIVFHGTQMGVKPAPVVASFSARGPSIDSLYVLKPDLIAPGVEILAAWPNGVSPTELSSDTRHTEFNVASGTSMSCPHVSGLAALLKGAHRDWSPAMIRSALMNTAYTHDTEGKPLLEEQFYNASTVWDMGAGHVNPVKAIDPGLVYDLTENDYMEFLCSINYTRQEIRQVARKSIGCDRNKHMPWNLNYPAINVAFGLFGLKDHEVMITRTVTHVSEEASVFNAIVTNPKGTTVTVEPTKISFTGKGQKQSYTVRIVSDKVAGSWGNFETQLGKLIWTNGKYNVVSPIVVVY